MECALEEGATDVTMRALAVGCASRLLRRRCGAGVLREGDECFQPFADDIRVRQARLVGKGFPGRIEERAGGRDGGYWMLTAAGRLVDWTPASDLDCCFPTGSSATSPASC